ncbi:MAG: tRNA (adenosine(37)-N6)-threonylcarbamoyltransferase complex dimerization subunit type 1 TsaB [Planctomycetota bacterium]
MSKKITLGIFASMGEGAVVLLSDDAVLSALPIGPTGTHNSRLFPVIEDVLSANSLKLQEVSAVAADVGPGSFTGIRLALSAARTLGWIGNLRLIPVVSLDVLAIDASNKLAAKGLCPDVFAVGLDARKRSVYCAVYSMDKTVSRARSPFLLPIADVARLIPPDCVLCGQGFSEYDLSHWKGKVFADQLDYSPALCAQAVTRALRKGFFCDWKNLVPIYLRRAEAEEVWDRKFGGRSDS